MNQARSLLLIVITLLSDEVFCGTFFGKLSLKTPTTGKRHSVFENQPFVFATRRSTYLKKNGDVFKVHLPGIVQGSPDESTVSFESVRFPGYYLSHDTTDNKNIFRIAKQTIPENPDDSNFENSATFYVERRAGIEGSGMLRLFNSPDQYLCIGKSNFADSALQAVSNDHSDDVDFKHRCSFFIQKLKDEKVDEMIKKSKEESATASRSPTQTSKSTALSKQDHVTKMLMEYNKKIETHQKKLASSQLASKKVTVPKVVDQKISPHPVNSKPLPAKAYDNSVKPKFPSGKVSSSSAKAKPLPVRGNATPVKTKPLPPNANTLKSFADNHLKSKPLATANAKPVTAKILPVKGKANIGNPQQYKNSFQSTPGFPPVTYMHSGNPMLSMYNTGYNNLYTMYGNMFNQPNSFSRSFYNVGNPAYLNYGQLSVPETREPQRTKSSSSMLKNEVPSAHKITSNGKPKSFVATGGVGEPLVKVASPKVTPQQLKTRKKMLKTIGPKKPINLHDFTITHNHREPSLNIDGLMTGVKLPVARSNIIDKVNGTKVNSTRSFKSNHSNNEDKNIFYTVKNITSPKEHTQAPSSVSIVNSTQNSLNNTLDLNNTKEFEETISNLTTSESKTTTDDVNSLSNNSTKSNEGNTNTSSSTAAEIVAENNITSTSLNQTSVGSKAEMVSKARNETTRNLNTTTTSAKININGTPNSSSTNASTSGQRNNVSGSKKNSFIKVSETEDNATTPANPIDDDIETNVKTENPNLQQQNATHNDVIKMNNTSTTSPSNTSLVSKEDVRQNSTHTMENNTLVSEANNSSKPEPTVHVTAVKKESLNATVESDKSQNKTATNGTLITGDKSKSPDINKAINSNNTSGQKKDTRAVNSSVAVNLNELKANKTTEDPDSTANLLRNSTIENELKEKAFEEDSQELSKVSHLLNKQNIQRDSKDDTASLLNSAFPHYKHMSDVYLTPHDNGPLHELPINNSKDFISQNNSTLLNSSFSTVMGGETRENLENLGDESNLIYNNNKLIGKADDFNRIEMTGIEKAMHSIDNNEISRLSKQMKTLSNDHTDPESVSEELRSHSNMSLTGVDVPQLNYNNGSLNATANDDSLLLGARNNTSQEDISSRDFTGDKNISSLVTSADGLGNQTSTDDLNPVENQTVADPSQLTGLSNQTLSDDSAAENVESHQQTFDSSVASRGMANRTSIDSVGLTNADTRSHLNKQHPHSSLLNKLMNDIVMKGIARDHVLPPTIVSRGTAHHTNGENNIYSLDAGHHNIEQLDDGQHGAFHQGSNYHVGSEQNHGYLETDPMSPPEDNAHYGADRHVGDHGYYHHYGDYGIDHGVDNHRYGDVDKYYGDNNNIDHLNSHALNYLHEPYDDHGFLNQEAWRELNDDRGFQHHLPFEERHPIVGSPNFHATTLYETDHYVPAKSNGLYLTDGDTRYPHMSDETNVVHHTHHVVTVKNEAEKQKMVHGLVDTSTDKCVSLQIVNDINRRYRLISSINKHGYTPRGKLFTLKTVFKDPSAHRVVMFRAINELDPADELLINGKKKLIAIPTSCNEPGKIVHVTHVDQHPSVVGCGSTGNGNCVTKKDVIARHVPSNFYESYEKYKEMQKLMKTKRSDVTQLQEKQQQGCVRTYGGTNSRSSSCCTFPFIFNGVSHSSCIGGVGTSWCGLTGNVDRDKRWGLCMTPTIPDTNDTQNLSCPSYCAQQCLPSCSPNCCFIGRKK